MNDLTFAVSGPTCQGCVRSVTKAIQKSDPQAQVEVNLDEMKLKAQTQLSAAELQARIEAAGFSGHEIAV